MNILNQRLRAMFKIPKAFSAPIIILLGLVVAIPSFATDYYVDINHASASDQNSGTEAMPWKSLQHAAQQPLQPGDTVWVKAGIYTITSGGTWERPVISPANSGQPGNPITFRSYPQHAAILDGGNLTGSTQALIGNGGQSHVVIDGFVVRNTYAKGILVMRGNGVVIQNNIITGVRHDSTFDNTDGLRIEQADGAIIRNNRIYNVHNGSNTQNAAGIKMYEVSNSTLENNEIYDAPSGIFDKRSGRDNIIRRNYIHDVNSGVVLKAAGRATGGDRVYENIISKTGTAVYIAPEGDTFDDYLYIYNNVLANYSDIGIRVSDGTTGPAHIYNNIFYRTGSVSTGDIVTYDDPPRTIANSDYNIFMTTPKMEIGRYLTNRNMNLSGWNSITGWDGNSQEQVDVDFANAANDDFRLNSGSIAIGAGHTGGVSSGAVVNIGAYSTGTEKIGILANLLQPGEPILTSVVIH